VVARISAGTGRTDAPPISRSVVLTEWERRATAGLYDVVKRLANRAEVRPFSPAGRGDPDDVTAHTLRHSVAWRMLRAEDGHSLYDVRNRLRHATILTTERRYDHFETI
jgi:integrase